ncbi:MAG: deoxyguanosinetriphosphate triphosphohydrolase [Dehalococcoidia bacterium]|nr:deoxyguanosinetriphosphate triphosphohydrolase [Dehalococcoidia bacterium]
MLPSTSSAIRHRLEAREEALSPYAVRSAAGKGRAQAEVPSPMRTEFQRDRDRILHTKAFRRLKHKTQVFLAPLGDHFATRLTHTLEVAQIARTISRALNLNEDLTEAIALGHDLGHTPFGHLGEEMLDHLSPQGFRHSQQSLRIVDILEKDGHGLNLTWEVRQGILHHSKPRGDFLADGAMPEGLTLEAQVCRLADALAYLNHDIDDALRAGVIQEDDLPVQVMEHLGSRSSQRINSMVSSAIVASWAATGEAPLPPSITPFINLTPEVYRVLVPLREFLFDRVYLPAGEGEKGQAARKIMDLLYHHYCHHSEEVPLEYGLPEDPPEQRAVDYVSGMTDRYALLQAERLSASISAPFKGW